MIWYSPLLFFDTLIYWCYIRRLNSDPLKNPYVPKETKDAIRKSLQIVVL